MGKKDRQSMEELWSKRFDEEAEFNEEEPLSRKAKREREKSISPILTVTLIFMALLIILPTSAYLWWSSRERLSEEPTSPSVEQVAENNQNEITADPDDTGEGSSEGSENESAVSAGSEEEEPQNEGGETEEGSSASSGNTDSDTEGSSETEASTEESGSETAASDSVQGQENENDPSTSESSTEEASQPDEEPVQDGDYYTVEAGDNMYRIALNHGMSTDELMQLNGIQNETVYVGQKLRVN